MKTIKGILLSGVPSEFRKTNTLTACKILYPLSAHSVINENPKTPARIGIYIDE